MLFAILILSGCSNMGWETFHEGTYKGTKYQLQSKQTTSFMSSAGGRIEWQMKLGNLKPVEFGVENTDWSPPYSTKIYGNTPFHYITDKDTVYTGKDYEPGSYAVFNTMLYLFPGAEDERNQKYYEFMRDEWKKIDEMMMKNRKPYNDFPHIIGLVFGEREKFVKRYTGKYMNETWNLTIPPDGRILFESENGGQTSAGLSLKVQMPGKKIFLRQDGLTLQELAHFTDKNKVSITKDFNIEQIASEK
ncbi:hypothetical protein [Chryseobacterium populi]|uniref:Uncharacterized protein n=1 Tax=Chryseobacterium populi TaxID=1144316 RepID=J2JPQ7_9FLAO|nr:hypothetical protein [Chryseobacterium populi]EJL69820.1 hypothetical protein PMI13_03112 [Chryseobacterium populi]